MHSKQPFQAVPLSEVTDWQRMLRLWKMASKYAVQAVKDDIIAIISASRPSGSVSAKMLVDIVHIITDSDKKFNLQVARFTKRLMRRCVTPVTIDALDALDGAIRFLIPLRKIEFRRMEVTGKVAYRNCFYFHWTNSLLWQISSFDVEKPEDWQYLLHIWEGNYGDIKLQQHLQSLVLYEMSSEDVQDPVSVIAVVGVFLTRTDAVADNILRGRFFDKVVEESHRLLKCQKFGRNASLEQKRNLSAALKRCDVALHEGGADEDLAVEERSADTGETTGEDTSGNARDANNNDVVSEVLDQGEQVDIRAWLSDGERIERRLLEHFAEVYN